MQEHFASHSVHLPMMRSITKRGLVLLASCFFLPAHATVVHKWVDADGVTHYSDEAPAAAVTQVIEIDAPASRASADSNYYSIANQWARMHKERLEQEQLRLEKSKQEAARQTTPLQVIYVNEPGSQRYVYALPGRYHYRPKRKRYYKKHNSYVGFPPNRHYRANSPPGLHAGRLKLGSYKNLQ